MQITKEKLDAEKQHLAKQIEQSQANTYALQGALQQCDRLAAMLDEPEPETKAAD